MQLRRRKKVFLHFSDHEIKAFVVAAKDKKIEKATKLPPDEAGLRQFVSEAKVNGAQAAIVVGGKHIVTRIITVPEVPPAEIEQLMRWEIPKHIPIPLENLIYDYEKLPQTEADAGNMYRLLTVGAKKDYIENICQLITKAGLKPYLVKTEDIILKHLFDQYIGPQDQGCCCVFFDGACGLFCFLQHDTINYIHNVERDISTVQSFAAEFRKVAYYLTSRNIIDVVAKVYIFGCCQEVFVSELVSEAGINAVLVNLDFTQYQVAGEKPLDASYTILLGLLFREAV
jgi:hypothetical protein